MIEVIKKIINQSDIYAVSYKEFIDLALFYPVKGYYQKENNPFGSNGDFYTAGHVNEVYSEVLTDFFIQVMDEQNLPINICELGAGNGNFAHQVLEAFRKKGIHSVSYYFIESNPHHRDKFLKKSNEFHVEVFSSINEFQSKIKNFQGLIFSNEFFDAQPISVVEKQNGELKEIYISIDEKGQLCEIAMPCGEDIKEWLSTYSITLDNNQRIEVPLYLKPILKDLSTLLSKGVFMTVDYGYSNLEWKDPRRKKGSLRGYSEHRQYDNILENIGNMDITHHVHWDPFIKIANEFNLDGNILLSQQQFLLDAGVLNYLERNECGMYFSNEAKKNRAIRTLLSGDFMGSKFDVCILGKNIDLSKLNVMINKKTGTR